MNTVSDPNILQRKAANPRESAWVAASAGSGKTKVLSDRVLNLLLSGTPPEKILCLTFTRTAAAQMENRIAGRLSKWAAEPDEDLARELEELRGEAPEKSLTARARRLFAGLLDTPGGLKVTTLHGFCQSLLKRFPIEAGISPQFDVLDERSAQELIEQAQNKILGLPQYAQALQTVTLATAEDGFLNVLKEMTLHLTHLKRLNREYPSDADLRRAYEHVLGLPENASAKDLVRTFCTLSPEREQAMKQALTVLGRSTKKTDLSKAAAIADFLSASQTEKEENIQTYLKVFLTGEGTIRDSLACNESAEALPMLCAEAQKAQQLTKLLQSERIMGLSLALLKLGMAIMQEYTDLKNVRSVMDYDDLITATRGLLEKSGAAAWVLFKLDGGIDHILVDEAQDTSPAQWAIIRSLAEEFFAGEGARRACRTIFAVGDKKQSIFSFQGADPDEFEKMRAYFEQKVVTAGKTWNNVPMYISFRSVPAVIDAVNFVLRNPPAAEGVIDAGEDATHLSWRRRQAGLVEVWPAEKAQETDTEKPYTKPVERVFSETPSARLARKIAERIARMVQNKERLKSEDRPIRPSDILILVRRRNTFIEDLSRELKTRGVPVSGVDRLKIASHIAVMDLMVLGDFLLLPEDDLALATVLRSPLCGVSKADLSADDAAKAENLGMPLDGISEEDLFSLAYGRGEKTLFDRLKTYENKPETPLGKAYAFLKDMLARVDKMRPYELYAYLLGPLGRQKAFVARLGVQALDALDEFMSLALQYDGMHAPSLQNFLKWVRQNDVEIKRDPEQSSFDAVRIMTVHAAKGLQAPIVFLPDTRQLRFIAPKSVWIKNNADGPELMLWAPKADFRDDSAKKQLEELKKKNRREYNRLLYVALTRAADRLYLCGWNNKTKAPEGNWYDLVRNALAPGGENKDAPYRAAEVSIDLFDEPVLRLESIQEIPPGTGRTADSPPVYDALPEWISEPAPEEPSPPRPLAPSRPDTEDPAVLSPLAEGRIQAFKRGTVIHSLLEMLPHRAEEKRYDAALKFVEKNMPEISGQEQRQIVQSVIGVISAPEFAPLFSPGSMAEVPVSGVVDGRVINGRIDRLVVLKNDILIVDYKSNRKIPESAADIPEVYIRQTAAYKSLLEKIYPDKNVRCFLLWTEAPKLIDITALVL